MHLQASGYSIERQIMALPLLPHGDIGTGLEKIKQFLQKRMGKVVDSQAQTCPSAYTDLSRRISDLLEYVRNYWLKMWPAERISRYRHASKTNNVAESRHAQYKYEFGTNPGPGLFIR